MLSMIVEDSESPHPTISDILSSPEPEVCYSLSSHLGLFKHVQQSPRTPLDDIYDQAYITYTSTPAKNLKQPCVNFVPWSFTLPSSESPSSDPETSGSLYSEESLEPRVSSSAIP